VRTVEAAEALRLLGTLGGAETDPPGQPLATRALAASLEREDAVRQRGSVMGFVERPPRGVPGLLTLEWEALTFAPDDGGEGAPARWPLAEIRGLQVASGALQVQVGKYLPHREFQLVDASPLRWETLLQRRISRLWRELGWGRVVEFQPRVLVDMGPAGGWDP
jgi:hypothetical protein